ncbi:alpha/beta fold hydrolase [Oryzifoliimicrobium ureilyticus]|uniref:alpha/beta fold hydrolase n=1 Tax=Oryzifoliimicrobium ureilyticus TaxID=3113724 RepID=UPI00307613C1
MLNHLAATLDNLDPSIVDGLAAEHRILMLDNRGVGASSGTSPRDIASMARNAVAFIRAMGFQQVDLLGFSKGRFIAQQIVLDHPTLVRLLILIGSMIEAALTFQDPKVYLFFPRTSNGRRAVHGLIARLKERALAHDKPIALASFAKQLTAIKRWGRQAPQDLSVINQPIVIAYGDDDLMVPTPTHTISPAASLARNWRSMKTPATAAFSSTTALSCPQRLSSYVSCQARLLFPPT